MSHPLVEQLRFVRSEFRRALAGLSDEDARRRLLPIDTGEHTAVDGLEVLQVELGQFFERGRLFLHPATVG